ncbi:MAG: crossover junction endodeoxyribonuclease RuvC [Ruminococcus sp.]|nr:crossover junction endodeoxyribonuclease RuvC [Ruminococcus sp.]MCR5141647.1 crossover junction endodeoxyribonuclease RuvC [Ruminococcus sp.]
MRIMGIDPGYAIVGYGLLDYSGNRFSVVNFGAITTSADMPFERRLLAIYDDMRVLLQSYKPDVVSIEKLFFNTNQKTGIDVAQARGVTLLPVIQAGIPFFEYTPLQVKSSITGYGRAEKQQVQELVRTILHLKEVPKPDDTADAVALAITHAYSINTRRLIGQLGK